MKSVETLPDGYKEAFTIDLQKDKKLALVVNGLAAAIGIVLALLAHFLIVPIGKLFEIEPILDYILRFAAILVGSIVYIILHEAVHGIFMKRYCTAKVNYGFTGMYAFAGSEGYYCRRHYIIIALAPVVIWGIVLAILNVFTNEAWFWVVYFIQISNLSGAAGDMYVTYRMMKLSPDILVNDTGVRMTVYEKE